jgi:hypothetical protein
MKYQPAIVKQHITILASFRFDPPLFVKTLWMDNKIIIYYIYI